MPLAGLFFNTNLYIDDLFFDTHMTEDHIYSTKLTKKPVEFGANITDNIVIEPIIVRCQVLLSNSFTLMSGIRAAFDSPFDFLNRKADGLSRLRQVQATRSPIKLITALAAYEDMYLTNIQGNLSGDNQNMLKADLTFEQVIQVGDSNIFNGNTGGPFAGRANKGNLQPSSTPI